LLLKSSLFKVLILLAFPLAIHPFALSFAALGELAQLVERLHGMQGVSGSQILCLSAF